MSRKTFDAPEHARRFTENVLDFVKKLSEENRYSALIDLLDGAIDLTDSGIK